MVRIHSQLSIIVQYRAWYKIRNSVYILPNYALLNVCAYNMTVLVHSFDVSELLILPFLLDFPFEFSSEFSIFVILLFPHNFQKTNQHSMTCHKKRSI